MVMHVDAALDRYLFLPNVANETGLGARVTIA